MKIFSDLHHEFPSLMEKGKSLSQYITGEVSSFGRFCNYLGIIIFLFPLASLIDRRVNKKGIFQKSSKITLLQNKKISFFILGIACIAVLLIILLGLISWPVSDDFSLNSKFSTSNPIVNAWEMYENWSGRYFSNLLLISLFSVFGIENINFMVGFNAVCIILLAYLLSIFLRNLKLKKEPNYFTFPIITCIIWLGLLPIIREVVYWAAGGFYIITALMSILWILAIYTLLFNYKKIRLKYLIFMPLLILSFLIGSANESLSPSLIFIAIVMLIAAGKDWKVNNTIVLIALIFLIGGSIFMYVAPGNFVRASQDFSSFDFNLIVMLKNYFNSFIISSDLAKEMIVLAGFGGISSSIIGIKKSLIKSETVVSYIKDNKKRFIIILSFLVAALISLSPYALVFNFFASRASVYYIIFLFIFTWGIVDFFSVFFIKNYKNNNKRMIGIALIPIICFGILSFTVITISIKNIYEGVPVYRQMEERHEYLSNLSKEERNNNITVKTIKGKIPELIYFNDIIVDEKSWVNVAVSGFYKLKSIRLEAVNSN